VSAEIAYLPRALKAPSLRESAGRLAERARTESWTHDEYLAACLQREVAARDAHGGEDRIRAARFPARKSIEEFDFDHARGLKRDLIAHLATLDFVAGKENVIFLGPPGTGKPTWRLGRQSAAVKPGTGCCSPPPANGSTSSPRFTAAEGYKPNSSGSAVTRCSSSTRSATSPSNRRREAVLPVGLIPLRTRQPDRHPQQAVRPLG
jgi:IstB-like ATP binding protein